MIYIMQAGDHGPIKIGYTKDESTLATRISSIQTGAPALIKVLHFCYGDIRLERQIHKALRRQRMKGEWFSWRSITARFVMLAVQKGIAEAMRYADEVNTEIEREERRTERQTSVEYYSLLFGENRAKWPAGWDAVR